MTARFAFEALAASPAFSLNARQISLLYRLRDDQGPHTVKRLAQEMRVRKGVISRLTSSLELAGMAMRIPDPHDGRVVFIGLTGAGMDFLDVLDAGDRRAAA